MPAGWKTGRADVSQTLRIWSGRSGVKEFHISHFCRLYDYLERLFSLLTTQRKPTWLLPVSTSPLPRVPIM